MRTGSRTRTGQSVQRVRWGRTLSISPISSAQRSRSSGVYVRAINNEQGCSHSLHCWNLCNLIVSGILLIVLYLSFASNSGFTQSIEDEEKIRHQFSLFILSTATFLEQCHAQEILNSENIQNETIEMGRALGIVREDEILEGLRRGANGQVYDFARGVWVTLPIRQDHCHIVLGEQKKLRNSLVRHFQ